MNDPTNYKTAPHNSRSKDCCPESECASGLRNNYFEGKRLTADSFSVEQKYLLGRRQLINRALHGWGVVYGYAIKAVPPNGAEANYACHLKIGPGLALDECGRELLQQETSIRFEDVILIDQPGSQDQDHEYTGVAQNIDASAPAAIPGHGKECWLLSVHYAEQDTGHVRIEDRCGCGHDEWDHTCETVRFSLQRIDCEKCCADFDCELDCNCETGECCDSAHMHLPSGVHKRGGCRCLCSSLTKLNPGADCDGLCDIKERCGGTVRVDLRHGVPLACVTLIKDQCGGYAFSTEVEACGPRRLVKRNDLLFDLIRGCDLTRIKNIGWPCHRQDISFEEFANLFLPAGENKANPVKTKFWVEFSRPVRKDTVRRDCFVMTVITSEPDDVWWVTLRVPIVGLELRPSGNEETLVDKATILVDGPWFWDTVKGGGSIFQNKRTRVELEVRGDFIIDCNGQTVDANTFGTGASPVPSGNGTPGGTFLSTFRVGPAPEPVRPPAYDSEDHFKGVS